MLLKTYKYHPFIDDYIRLVELGEIKVCKEQKQLIDLVHWKLRQKNIVIHGEQIEKSVEIPAKYFPFDLLPWQRFCNAFIFGVRYDTGFLVYDEHLHYMGRGAGKTAYGAWNDFYMLTGHHGIMNYDIDIVANCEDQAEREFKDVWNVLENPRFKDNFKQIFDWNLEKITHKKTKSTLTYNTANAKTKDGKRSGCVKMDEYHAYENYEQIKVFTSGLGKISDSRKIITTTDGDVRGGPLDNILTKSKLVLSGELPNSSLFPFICRLDDPEEVKTFAMWEKANPTLRHNPSLIHEMEKEYEDMQISSELRREFMTKRMNIPTEDTRREVASYEDRLATNQPFPKELHGIEAIGALDFADVRDFCSTGLLFKQDGKRYWRQHTFIHHSALKLQDINPDIINLGLEKGLCEIVHSKSIDPERIVNWFLEQAKIFYIKKIVMDGYRASILKPKLEEAGFEVEVVRRGPITHAKLAPLVDDIFINHTIVFGDDPLMRWYVGNVYIDEKGNGNKEYCKIEKVKRKTDGFFALLHALTQDSELREYQVVPLDLGVYVY